MRAHARASIVFSVAGVESFCIWAHATYALRETDKLPDKWISKQLSSKSYEHWPLHDKVRYFASLCGEPAMSSSRFLRNRGKLFNKFIECIKVRNTIAHGTATEMALEVTGRDHMGGLVDDSGFRNNYWQHTGFPRDVFSIGDSEAQKTFDICISVMEWLVATLSGRMKASDLTTQKLKLDNQELWVSRESVTDEPPAWTVSLRKILET